MYNFSDVKCMVVSIDSVQRFDRKIARREGREKEKDRGIIDEEKQRKRRGAIVTTAAPFSDS